MLMRGSQRAGPSPGAPAETASRSIRRQRVLLVVAAGAAAASVGGLAASTLVRSPAQLAAQQGPPKASVLTAPVESQVLTDTIVLRGTVVAAGSVAVTPNAAQGATTLVVTGLRLKPGASVQPGDVLVEVSGRPVIALPGATPAYRALKPGDTGKDVAELQAALASLGYRDTDTSGTFGPGTKDTVAALYAHLGYDAPTTGGANDSGDRPTLQAAAQAVTAAQRTVTADKQALAQANTAGALTTAHQQLTYAEQDLATAQESQAELIATTGVEMPLDEFVFLPAFPARIDAVNGAVGSAVTAPLLTIDTGALSVVTVLTQDQQSLVKPGMTVQLEAEALNQSAAATATSIGAYQSGQSGSGGSANSQSAQTSASALVGQPGYPLTITPSSPLASAWLGQDVRVTITAARTATKVLVVPAAAISAGADGRTSVTVQHADGTQSRIPVAAGLDANGYVEVTPAAGYALAAGQNVVTGQ